MLKPGETFASTRSSASAPRRTASPRASSSATGSSRRTSAAASRQVATTTFNAIFFAGLEDVEHKPHSFYIDRYPVGREATVAWGAVDLRFKNDTPYGVLVQAYGRPRATPSTPGAMTVSMYSTKYWDITAEQSGTATTSPRRRPAGSAARVRARTTATAASTSTSSGCSTRRAPAPSTTARRCTPATRPPTRSSAVSRPRCGTISTLRRSDDSLPVRSPVRRTSSTAAPCGAFRGLRRRGEPAKVPHRERGCGLGHPDGHLRRRAQREPAAPRVVQLVQVAGGQLHAAVGPVVVDPWVLPPAQLVAGPVRALP